MTDHGISDQDYAAAIVAGREAARAEFRGQSVTFLPDCDAVLVMTVRNGGFVVPLALIGALQGVSREDLGKMELWPDGSLIEIAHLDIHISVDGMIRAALPVLLPSGMLPSGEHAARSPRRPPRSKRAAA